MEPWVASFMTALIGGMVVTVGYAVNATRRDSKNGNAGALLEHFLDNQERVAASLEQLANSHARTLEILADLSHGQDELVTLHRAMEVRREALGELVEKGGHG